MEEKYKKENKMKERWLEAGIFFKPEYFTLNRIWWTYACLLHPIKYRSWHYFLEPNYELRFRILTDKKNRDKIRKKLKLLKKTFPYYEKIIFRRYYAEQGLYGKEGFVIAKEYFENGAKTAKKLIYVDAIGRLISPYEKWSPIHFHLNRYVHLFANQLGYSIWDEFKWAIRYAFNRLIVYIKYRKR